MKSKCIITLLLLLFSSLLLARTLVDLSSKQLVEMKQNKNALLIDIRTEKEWILTGTIPGSHKLQFFTSNGKYDTEKWLSELDKLKSSKYQAIILVCRSGGRSGVVGNMLIKKKGIKNIYHLSNGINSWIKAGNKIIK